jgi:hypothetical protein
MVPKGVAQLHQFRVIDVAHTLSMQQLQSSVHGSGRQFGAPDSQSHTPWGVREIGSSVRGYP